MDKTLINAKLDDLLTAVAEEVSRLSTEQAEAALLEAALRDIQADLNKE